MARLAFKASGKFILTKHQQLRQAIKDAVPQAIDEGAQLIRETIAKEIDNTRVARHPITEMVNQVPWSLKENLKILSFFDETRVGFFDLTPEEIHVVYMQEFGGTIKITDAMRDWYNTMAFLSLGWQPETGTYGINEPSEPFYPLKPSTKSFSVPPRAFMRASFRQLGAETVLTNNLLFAMRQSLEGRVEAGDNLSDPANPRETDQTN